ncbi:unnamed protein product [Linum trigynum]|uniref:Uncharacterized protein n=1 Tax=Linum trigynum TaxID=586398 RepID=A0AAV2E3F0_9ROSI
MWRHFLVSWSGSTLDLDVVVRHLGSLPTSVGFAAPETFARSRLGCDGTNVTGSSGEVLGCFFGAATPEPYTQQLPPIKWYSANVTC